jgi:hypothetical protein
MASSPVRRRALRRDVKLQLDAIRAQAAAIDMKVLKRI